MKYLNSPSVRFSLGCLAIVAVGAPFYAARWPWLATALLAMAGGITAVSIRREVRREREAR